MSEDLVLPQSSPPTLANFSIPFDNDVMLEDDFEREGLFKFIRENSLIEINETDSSFFPRAVTDLDCELKDNPNENFDCVNTRNENTGQTVVEKSENLFKMEGHSYQPDVITSNSNQRVGPDGSPALCPPRSQGFVNSSNLSETGELFAPVRTLTFSDVESSHVEDSYVNTSRLVSTPEHIRASNRNFDFGIPLSQHNGINVNTVQPNDTNNRIGPIQGTYSRESSPEFRQMDGEVETDSGLLGTGTFKPTFHGINQEFLDHFTGKTRTAGNISPGEIFSPLAQKLHSPEGNERKTPPLHSPGPNSPYSKQLASQGISLTRHIDHHSDDDDDEIQFQMSPTRSAANQHSKQSMRTNFLKETTFQPIEKGHQSYMTHKNVPRNLSEYLDQATDDDKEINYGQRYDMNRQGDGVEGIQDNSISQPIRVNHLDGQTNQPMHDSRFDRQFSAMTASDFEKRYLHKTQVSVKLPQATYDTLKGEFVIQEPNRGEPAGLPPDSLENEADFGSGFDDFDKHTDGGVITEVVTSGPTGYNKEHCGKQSLNEDGSVTNLKRGGMENSEKHQISTTNMAESRLETNQPTSSNSGIKSIYQDEFTHPNSSTSNMNTSETPVSFYMTGQSQTVVTNSTSENTGSRITASQQSLPNQPTNSFSHQPPSRLLQETISQRNKTNQKFVSTVPGVSKSAANQAKEFKKPVDNSVRNSSSSASGLGARKNGANEAGNSAVNVKPKSFDKQKSKAMAVDSQYLKQSKHSQIPARSFGNHSQTQPLSKQNQSVTDQYGRSNANPGVPSSNQRRSENPNNISSHSFEDLKEEARVVTQVQNTSPVPEPRASNQFQQVQNTGDQNLDVRGMEDVRKQLQSMLKLTTGAISPHDRSQYEHSEIVAGFGMNMSNPAVVPTQQGPVDMSWSMCRKSNEEEMMENFPSFSSQFLVDSGNVSRSDVSLHAENQRLREMLEKERYRRKHCEQYIQQLNVKILETQQQLAVAVSTDKRKDLMIEQLDKQLALVVEGWRKRDAEKDEQLGNVQQEKSDIEKNMMKQQEMIRQFEQDMSEAVEALRHEREKSATNADEMKQQITEAERKKAHAEEMMNAEQEKCQLIQSECENLREARDNLDKKLEQMQRRLHREQDEWFQREQELLQRIEEVGEKNTKILQMERMKSEEQGKIAEEVVEKLQEANTAVKSEEQGKIAEEVVEKLQEANTAVKKLEMDLDAALREKESTKVEMGIMEAKFENAQRVLETDLQTQMEKQIAAQIVDVQNRYERSGDEMLEKHKCQVLELSQRHAKESEKQLALFREEMSKKEDDHRKQLQELETRLLEYRNENSELKLAKQKLESTRLEILTKLQYAMQTQWNEALTLLASTPQRKFQNANASLLTEGDVSTISTQPSLSSINFNLPTRSSQGQQENYSASPPRTSHQHLDSHENPLPNQNDAYLQSTKQRSPIKQGGGARDIGGQSENLLPNQNDAYYQSANQSSPIKHGAGAKEVEGDNDVTVETTALSHMRDFQDYMNRLAETPEWISALTKQGEDPPDGQKPLSSDISMLLATYLSQQPAELNSQPKQSMDDPLSESSNQSSSSHSQSNFSKSKPPSETSNQMPFSSYSTDAIQNNPANEIATSSHVPGQHSDISSQNRSQLTSRNAMFSSAEGMTPLREKSTSFSQSHFDESVASHSNSVIFRGMVQSSSPMYEDSGMARAVAIRPPQQGDDPYKQDDNESVISSIAGVGGGQMGGYFQGGQCFSPPTRQRRVSFNDSSEDLNKHTNRLNDDYSDLSERMKKHESHQNDLQKYIHMLLNKPQIDSESLGQNESLFSQDGLDLNDTAQAAQLQSELDRIQELRERQEWSSKSQNKQAGNTSTTNPGQSHEQQQQPPVTSDQSKILNDDQLTEITRLLNAVKDQPQTGNQQIGELLNVLKDVQKEKGSQSDLKPKAKGMADRPRPVTTVTKRNVQFHPGKGVEGNKQDKNIPNVPRSAQTKKIERKIAGSASKGEKGAKPAAWK